MAAGGASFIDALNFHYFNDFHNDWERWDPSSPVRLSGALPAPTCGIVDDGQGTPYDAGGIDVIAKASHIKNRMQTCFGVDKPIWLTETAGPSTTDPLSQQEQARYVPKVYTRALSYGIPSITWFALTTPNHPDGQGLLDDNFNPKPAFYAYQTMTSELMGLAYARTLNVSGLEGYYFTNPANGAEKLVTWGSGTLVIPGAQQVRLVNYDGTQNITISDGGAGDADGSANGSVSVNITADPVYIQVLS